MCYVTERYGLSDTMILEQACREAGLTEPLRPFEFAGLRKQRAMFALSRRDGWLFGRPRSRTHSETLAQLLESVRAHPELDVQLIPVSILVGRAPDRQSGWFRVLFSENWVVVGRFRRLISLLLNGRGTIVQFAAPVSLRQFLADEHAAPNALRKLSRVLRIHFRRIRAAVIGPDLSHRRTMIEGVINAAPVQNAIAVAASKDGISKDQATAKARAFAWEIAADQSHPFVRSVSFMLTGLWDRIYDGVNMHHFDKLRALAPGHEIIYVPCHRSHIDYLLMSYLLYRNGVVVPHIAAGQNLNLPVLGALLRRGGAFFMRRSFSDPFYSTVFRAYMSQVVRARVSSNTSSRAALAHRAHAGPRGALLSMTLRSSCASRTGRSYSSRSTSATKNHGRRFHIGELSGKPKEKESLLRPVPRIPQAARKLRQGWVNFGELIFSRRCSDGVDADWRAATADEAKPTWLKNAVDTLAERIVVNINRAADVNPINLLALALLSAPKQRDGRERPSRAARTEPRAAHELPYADRVTVTPLDAAQIIAYGEKMQFVQRIAHPLGDVLVSEAATQSCFRTSHAITCCTCSPRRHGSPAAFNNRRMARATILRLGRLVYPFIQAECSCRGRGRLRRAARGRRSIFSSRAACSTPTPTGASSAAVRARAMVRSSCARLRRTCCRRSNATTSRSPRSCATDRTHCHPANWRTCAR